MRGADTARPDLAPEAAGLLAASLGLSRMYADDLEQLEAGMLLYDAFYRWCRDATGETHNWPSNQVRAVTETAASVDARRRRRRTASPSPRRCASGCGSRRCRSAARPGRSR